MSSTVFLAVLAAVSTILGSSGVWAYVQKKDDTLDARTKLLMGLGYIQIATLGMRYIERGWITRDELEDFERYFFEPYRALGGNGVATRIWRDVSNLPFHNHGDYPPIFRTDNERFIKNVPVVAQSGQSAFGE